MTNKQSLPAEDIIDLTDEALRGIKPPITKKFFLRSKPAPSAARADTSAGASASEAAPEKSRNLAVNLFGDGSASSLIPSGSGSRSTVSTPGPSSSTPGPSRKLQSINLEEQRRLEQRDNRLERFSKPKDGKCLLCKVSVTKGVDFRTGKTNWWHHINGKQHKKLFARKTIGWHQKCFFCPEKKFETPDDWHKHLKSKGHRTNKDKKSVFKDIEQGYY